MSELVLAVTQMECGWDRAANIAKAEAMVRDAVAKGANLVLLQELFETPYFCSEQDAKHLELAAPFEGNALIGHFAELAKELGVVLPVSFFERTERQFFNSMAMVDADGSVLGVYRKTHIPDGPGYQEKLLYPTAIGSEPQAPELRSLDHWQRVMQGHAAANMAVVAAANRVGVEKVGEELTFYGGSFIADETGAMVEVLGEDEGIVLARFNLSEIQRARAAWGIFRDRRPERYVALSE